MSFLLDKCTLKVFDKDILSTCERFSCGHGDLDDFFYADVVDYQNTLLGKSYCFTLNENPSLIVCAFTVSNDSIKTTHLPGSTKKKVTKKIPRAKHMKSYPAVLIGRLGVNKDYRIIEGEEIRVSTQLMDFIKFLFIEKSYKSACRYLVVDSYNDRIPMQYYQNNGFETLFASEEVEKNYNDREELKTRFMYFDLIDLMA